jgi:hypothetical protein
MLLNLRWFGNGSGSVALATIDSFKGDNITWKNAPIKIQEIPGVCTTEDVQEIKRYLGLAPATRNVLINNLRRGIAGLNNLVWRAKLNNEYHTNPKFNQALSNSGTNLNLEDLFSKSIGDLKEGFAWQIKIIKLTINMLVAIDGKENPYHTMYDAYSSEKSITPGQIVVMVRHYLEIPDSYDFEVDWEFIKQFQS